MKSHIIKDLDKLDRVIIPKIDAGNCQKHDLKLNFFYDNCNVYICRDCLPVDHRNHVILNKADALIQYYKDVESSVERGGIVRDRLIEDKSNIRGRLEEEIELMRTVHVNEIENMYDRDIDKFPFLLQDKEKLISAVKTQNFGRNVDELVELLNELEPRISSLTTCIEDAKEFLRTREDSEFITKGKRLLTEIRRASEWTSSRASSSSSSSSSSTLPASAPLTPPPELPTERGSLLIYIVLATIPLKMWRLFVI